MTTVFVSQHCKQCQSTNGMWLDLKTTHRQTWLFSSTSTYYSTDVLTTRGVARLVVHGTSGSTSYETIPPVRLESSRGVLSTLDMVVQRRDGPRRLRDHDEWQDRISPTQQNSHYSVLNTTDCLSSCWPTVKILAAVSTTAPNHITRQHATAAVASLITDNHIISLQPSHSQQSISEKYISEMTPDKNCLRTPECKSIMQIRKSESQNGNKKSLCTVHHFCLQCFDLLFGRQEEYTGCKNGVVRCWCGVCLERGADCLRMVQLMPLHPQTPYSLASFKSRLVLPFWYRLTQVVLEKRPLNGCSSSVVQYISKRELTVLNQTALQRLAV